MDSFPCHTQECRRFKSDRSVQIKHVTFAFEPYKVSIIIGSFMTVATPASVIAIMYKTSLGSYSLRSFPKQWQLSMVKPPSTKRGTQHTDALTIRHLSVCAKRVPSSSGDTFCHDHSAETTHKLHK